MKETNPHLSEQQAPLTQTWLDIYLDIKHHFLKSPGQILWKLARRLALFCLAWMAAIGIMHPLVMLAAVYANADTFRMSLSELTLGHLYGDITMTYLAPLAFIMIAVVAALWCSFRHERV